MSYNIGDKKYCPWCRKFTYQLIAVSQNGERNELWQCENSECPLNNLDD